MSVHHSPRGYQRTPGHVYAWRFVSGNHMWNRTTNYTFIHRATRDISEHGRASRWAHRAGYERATVRIIATAVTLAILYGYFTSRTLTIDAVTGALSALTVFGIVRARFAIRNHGHYRKVVRPMYQTMTQITQINSLTIHHQAYGDNPKRHLRIPVNYRDPKARIRFMVPQSWEARPQMIRQLNDLVERRLGGDWDAIPHLHAYPPYIEFAPSPAPPKALTFADMKAVMDAGRENEIIVGKGTHDKVITIDLDSESPHVAISMGTGGGKSSLLRVIVAYLIHHGVERIDIIDPKRVSHNWAKGIPGVYIWRTMAEQMSAVADFRKRMEARYDELDRNENAVFPRHVLVIEEQNSWIEYAKTYWEDYRSELDSAERGKTPRRNPVISDLAYCLFQGRQARMNIFSVFQRMSASASGGGDMRENYGAKILARYSPQTWAMLVGTRPVPRSSRIPGRGRFVLGDEDREIQMILMGEADAKGYALAGIRPEAHAEPFDALRDVPADNAGSDDVPAMSLREMCDAGLIPVRYSAAKRARTRAGDKFPSGTKTPNGLLYEPDAVKRYFANRANRASN